MSIVLQLEHTSRRSSFEETATEMASPYMSVEDPVVVVDRAIDAILDECFFTLGQGTGMTKTMDDAALGWLIGRYRAKFTRTIERFGNRWTADRHNVTAMALLLAERAVRYAGANEAIDLTAAMHAAADVERYCGIHARRRFRGTAAPSDDQPTYIAGYWCTPAPTEG